ncbi:lactonase family protein [Amycolatopsis jiangsuensis]|uniref:6-phosphogluconolactonase (Cycloisomerase 2 family) n=1 Tax=Amycolatopsis jiangsuensis TaxID=1181879 RepID=A0A840IXY2_9PSEU|nr:beta-propeller fold lactonase family protein [Amycolatopsis jiangsuensis]MBB4687506.1 6-phosphogluconolactonase (cycloisomerase 2 family) [Amycolatopsis jiangsuensis]
MSAVLVGCYTAEKGGNGTGVSVLRRASSGELTHESTLPMASPSWLAKHPALPMVYAANETETGEVTSISLSGDELTALDVEATGGADPCHLAVSPDGRFLFCANYTGGSLAVFALRADGRIEGRTDLVQHSGGGPDAERQESAHVHMAVPSPDGSVVSAVDLGTDEIRSYSVSAAGKLSPRSVSKLPPGTGPRQLVRVPGSAEAYVVGELSGELLTVRETSVGDFEVIASTPATAAGGASLVAHLEVLESGTYLSNRGPDCVTSFEGARAKADQPCGAHPRHFAVVGEVCYVAAQQDDVITAFPLADLGKVEPRRFRTGSPSFVLPL